MEETKPSVQTCHTLLESLQQICLRHGEEVSYYKQLFQTIEFVINQIENDDMPVYLRWKMCSLIWRITAIIRGWNWL